MTSTLPRMTSTLAALIQIGAGDQTPAAEYLFLVASMAFTLWVLVVGIRLRSRVGDSNPHYWRAGLTSHFAEAWEFKSVSEERHAHKPHPSS